MVSVRISGIDDGEVDVSEQLEELLPLEAGESSDEGSNNPVASTWAAHVQEGFVDVRLGEATLVGASAMPTGTEFEDTA